MTDYQRVQAHLIAAGVMDEQNVTRRPRPGHCRRCRLAVTAAISDTGFTVLTWPVPTTTLGELQALMAGLRTYAEHPDALNHRDVDRITGNSADHRRVLVEHRCGDPPPPANPVHAAARVVHVLPVDPPF